MDVGTYSAIYVQLEYKGKERFFVIWDIFASKFSCWELGVEDGMNEFGFEYKRYSSDDDEEAIIQELIRIAERSKC